MEWGTTNGVDRSGTSVQSYTYPKLLSVFI